MKRFLPLLLFLLLLLLVGCSQETEVFYYDNGQKESELIYKDKKLIKSTYWYENGQKSSEGIYKDGKEDGLWTGWYENGQKKLEGTYKDGWMISSKEWNEDGSVKE